MDEEFVHRRGQIQLGIVQQIYSYAIFSLFFIYIFADNYGENHM
jgi:hypothetical protein